MKIQVILYASLAHLLPPSSCGNACFLELDQGATIGSLLGSLKVPSDSPKIIFLNGRHAKETQILCDGDRVAVFPPIAGG
ncbi:MAG: MoaD/ThiS family protein [Desulfomonile sp.]|nr:MoaD/ThiS family protein [Deltaproteobacteria bacterium]